MATRNLTKKFNEIRNGAKAIKKLDQFNFLGESNSSSSSSGFGFGMGTSDGSDDLHSISYNSDDELLRRGDDDNDGGSVSGSVSVSVSGSLTQQLPPRWVEVIDGVEVNMVKMQQQIKELGLLHSKRLRVTFAADHETHSEQLIDAKTREVTALFRATEQSVKRLGLDDRGAAGGSLSQAELAVRNNLQRALAKRIQVLSVQFRRSQKEYMEKLRGQQAGGGGGGTSSSSSSTGNHALLEFLDQQSSGNVSGDGDGDGGFSTEQLSVQDDVSQVCLVCSM